MTFWNRLTLIWVAINLFFMVVALVTAEPLAYLILGLSTVILGVVMIFRTRAEGKYR
mgnify:CR=1 FL=1